MLPSQFTSLFCGARFTAYQRSSGSPRKRRPVPTLARLLWRKRGFFWGCSHLSWLLQGASGGPVRWGARSGMQMLCGSAKAGRKGCQPRPGSWPASEVALIGSVRLCRLLCCLLKLMALEGAAAHRVCRRNFSKQVKANMTENQHINVRRFF